MQLTPCGACGTPISPMAQTCPRCGHPQHVAPQMVVTKPHWTQDRNLGCLAACIVFIVLPTLFLLAKCAK